MFATSMPFIRRFSDCWFLVAVITVIALAPVASADTVAENGGGDILSLVEDGRLGLRLTAHGAYRLEARMQNLTDKPLRVKIIPGLVGDTFAQSDIFPQLVPGGSQGMGLIMTDDIMIAAAQTQTIHLSSVCLNYGIPEPHERNPVYLKRVEDYTSNPQVHAALIAVAKAGVDTPVAQAVMWHFTDKLDFASMVNRPELQISSAQVQQAKALATPFEEGQTDAIAAGRDTSVEPPVLSLQINPDPRRQLSAFHSAADFVPRAIARIKRLHPEFEVGSRNYAPTDSSSGALVQWSVMVSLSGENSGEAILQMLPYRRFSKNGIWEKGDVARVGVAVPKKTKSADLSEWLADEIYSAAIGQSVKVGWERGGKRKSVVIDNYLPTSIGGIVLGGSRQPSTPVILGSLAIPPGARDYRIELTDADAQTLASVQKLSARGLEIQKGR